MAFSLNHIILRVSSLLQSFKFNIIRNTKQMNRTQINCTLISETLCITTNLDLHYHFVFYSIPSESVISDFEQNFGNFDVHFWKINELFFMEKTSAKLSFSAVTTSTKKRTTTLFLIIYVLWFYGFVNVKFCGDNFHNV